MWSVRTYIYRLSTDLGLLEVISTMDLAKTLPILVVPVGGSIWGGLCLIMPLILEVSAPLGIVLLLVAGYAKGQDF